MTVQKDDTGVNEVTAPIGLSWKSDLISLAISASGSLLATIILVVLESTFEAPSNSVPIRFMIIFAILLILSLIMLTTAAKFGIRSSIDEGAVVRVMLSDVVFRKATGGLWQGQGLPIEMILRKVSNLSKNREPTEYDRVLTAMVNMYVIHGHVDEVGLWEASINNETLNSACWKCGQPRFSMIREHD